MAYTKFGEFMRIQRIKHHEVMSDTAALLGVAIPFVSAVENGKRNVPDEWFSILVSHYQLSDTEQAELRNAIYESKTQVKVNLSSATNSQRQVALQLQRSFDEIDEETAKAIIEILNNHKGD